MNSSLEKTFRIISQEKKINECDNMSLRMKVTAALILLVDLVCAKTGDTLVVILSLVALCLFFFLDVYFLKKKKKNEIEMDDINNDMLDMCAEGKNQVYYPIGYYALVAVIMIVWLIKIS